MTQRLGLLLVLKSSVIIDPRNCFFRRPNIASNISRRR